jgi:hypothetical protein
MGRGTAHLHIAANEDRPTVCPPRQQAWSAPANLPLPQPAPPAVGYVSEFAYSRAFRRDFGLARGQYRHRETPDDGGQPTAAAIDGLACGGGHELAALARTPRAASERACLQQPEVPIGFESSRGSHLKANEFRASSLRQDRAC